MLSDAVSTDGMGTIHIPIQFPCLGLGSDFATTPATFKRLGGATSASHVGTQQNDASSHFLHKFLS